MNYFHTALDFEKILKVVVFNVGDDQRVTRCIEVEIFNDNEEENPEDFVIFIFVISPSEQIEILQTRMVKFVTIIDGESLIKFIPNSIYAV